MTAPLLVVIFLHLLVRDKWVGRGEGQFVAFPLFFVTPNETTTPTPDWPRSFQ